MDGVKGQINGALRFAPYNLNISTDRITQLVELKVGQDGRTSLQLDLPKVGLVQDVVDYMADLKEKKRIAAEKAAAKRGTKSTASDNPLQAILGEKWMDYQIREKAVLRAPKALLVSDAQLKGCPVWLDDNSITSVTGECLRTLLTYELEGAHDLKQTLIGNIVGLVIMIPDGNKQKARKASSFANWLLGMDDRVISELTAWTGLQGVLESVDAIYKGEQGALSELSRAVTIIIDHKDWLRVIFKNLAALANALVHKYQTTNQQPISGFT